ncbi:hypothetical protein N6H13_19415 [Paenibacillus sp. CC-CFT742]|nr:hypothetical protein [Paenibacillus sp. CC-CFT742]WJH27432.1 hypothetical protein N6H13_19415 [Paenibacillus sp. CC-CFT742]
MSREQEQYTGNKDSGNPEGLLTSVWDVRALMSENELHVVGNLVMGELEAQGSDEKKRAPTSRRSLTCRLLLPAFVKARPLRFRQRRYTVWARMRAVQPR